MSFDSVHFDTATQERDFYRCETAEHMAEEAAYFDALFTAMALDDVETRGQPCLDLMALRASEAAEQLDLAADRASFY